MLVAWFEKENECYPLIFEYAMQTTWWKSDEFQYILQPVSYPHPIFQIKKYIYTFYIGIPSLKYFQSIYHSCCKLQDKVITVFGCLLIPSTPSPSTTPAVALASEQTLRDSDLSAGLVTQVTVLCIAVCTPRFRKCVCECCIVTATDHESWAWGVQNSQCAQI